MACYILTGTGEVIVRKSFWALTTDERNSPAIKEKLAELDAAIKTRVGDTIKESEVDPDLIGDLPVAPEGIFDNDDDEVIEPYDTGAIKSDADDYTPEAYDQYLTAEVLLPHGGEAKKARVINRKRDKDGLPVGKHHSNPLLDTRMYEVEFPDGSTEAYTANMIAENIYAQVDDEGNSFSLLSEITEHCTNGHALSKDEGFTLDRHGQ